MSLGISYTFTTHLYKLIVPYADPISKTLKRITVEDWRPHRYSAILFVNPLAMTSDSFNAATNSNIGIGLGKRWGGGFAVYGTIDFFSLTQPKKAFIAQYDGKDDPYEVNGAIQYTLDPADVTIFTRKFYPAIGVKFVYSLGVFNSFRQLVGDMKPQDNSQKAIKTTPPTAKPSSGEEPEI